MIMVASGTSEKYVPCKMDRSSRFPKWVPVQQPTYPDCRQLGDLLFWVTARNTGMMSFSIIFSPSAEYCHWFLSAYTLLSPKFPKALKNMWLKEFPTVIYTINLTAFIIQQGFCGFFFLLQSNVSWLEMKPLTKHP